MEALVQQALHSSTCHVKLICAMNNKHKFEVFLVYNCGAVCVCEPHSQWQHAQKTTANGSVQALQINLCKLSILLSTNDGPCIWVKNHSFLQQTDSA